MSQKKKTKNKKKTGRRKMSNKSGKIMSRLFEVLFNLKTRLWNLPVSGRILNYDNFAFKQLLHNGQILHLLRDYESVDEP